MTALADPRRVIGNLAQLGTIESVDLAEATCRVRLGEIVTGDLPWIAPRAGSVRVWSPPSVGEQCLLLCPEGDLEGGVVVPGLFSDANPAPADDDVLHVQFADGAVIRYDPAAHDLDVLLPAGGSANVDAPGGLTITGDVTIDGHVAVIGDVGVKGRIDATTDVVGAGKSLKDHVHKGVQAGGAVSGPPQ